MNTNRIKTLCAVFAVVLTGVFVAKGDGMEKIPYLAWDEDAQGFVEETCDYAEVVTPETDTLQPGTWYVVTNDVTRGLIAVSGTAHLILCDGASLTVAGETMQAGLGVSSSAALSIYAQREGTGRLTATGGDLCAGIGGDISSCGAVTINGGIVQATGGDGGAGIGGGNGVASGMVTIRGGTITAQGGRNSAGIGGGEDGGGAVTILGGKIAASGSDGAPAIGSGRYGPEATVAVSGGVFAMQLEDSCLADGYDVFANSDPETKGAYPYEVGHWSTISVGSLDHVTAVWTRGDGAVTNAIQGTSFKAKSGETVTVVVTPPPNFFLYGGEPTYTFVVPWDGLDISDKIAKGALYLDENGASQTRDDYILVTAETTTLENGKWYVVNSTVSRGSINVSGTARLVLCDGAKLTLQGEHSQAGLRVTPGNSIVIYGQREGTGQLQANGGGAAAGIGGGESENAGTVTINGGVVTATGSSGAAGVGGGWSQTLKVGNGGTVTINGGRLLALGGSEGAGIGGGELGSGGTVKISGGCVMATGGTGSIGKGMAFDADDGTVSITGGCFGMAVQESWLALGLAVIANQDAATCGEYPWMVAPGYQVTVGNLDNMTVVWTCEGSGVTNAVAATAFNVPQGADVTFLFTARANYSFNGERSVVLSVTVDQDLDISGQVPKPEVSSVEYLDANGELRTVDIGSYTLVTAETTTLGDGWYVVADPKVSRGCLSVTGNAHLILGDGESLTLQGDCDLAGLVVPEGKSLSIYCQRAGTGALKATGGPHGAGIGGSWHQVCGTVTINGGTVTATGGEYGAGIGGGESAAGGRVIINGGMVQATGGGRGAGIGGGGSWYSQGAGAGAEVVICGGRISAEGQAGALPIGPGVTDTGAKGPAGKTSISGGVFAMELDDDWPADRWLAYTNDDPETCQEYPWTVVPACLVTVGEHLSAAWTTGDGSGSGIASKYSFYVPSNMPITVSFTPASGYWLEGESVWHLGVVTEDVDLTGQVTARPNTLAYIKEDGKSGTVTGYAVVHDATNTFGTGWYAVLDTDVRCDAIAVNGAAKLLLCDGMKLSALNGISVADGASLTIYGQAGGAGFLDAQGGAGEPGIGGAGSVTIVGGTVTAVGGAGDGVPGIGGAKPVVIRGGSVGASVANAQNASGAALWCVTVEGLGTAAPTFADLPNGYGTGGITPVEGQVWLWWPNGTNGFKVNGETYCVTVKNAHAVAAKAQWEIGADVTAAWADGVLTISGTGKIDDFASADAVPWQGLKVTNVTMPTNVKPGRHLLAGLGDTTTVNGAVPVSLIRQFSGDFLVGEVAPAEATALEIDGGQVKLTVEVDASTDLKTWKSAKMVDISVPVEGEKGFYLLKTK